MNANTIKKSLQSKDYEFLRKDQRLGRNLLFLTVGGSHAYGTNVESSDLDIRGCTLNSPADILSNENFEVFTHNDTDTIIYAFNKLLFLLSNCNPNTIEMLGNRPEFYFFVSSIGQELIDNSHMFLSKKAVYSFGGYATAQLRRLENKSSRVTSQSRRELHILNSIMNAYHTFPEKYFSFDDDSIRLYIDQSMQENMDTEIFMDIRLTHYPLRDYKAMWSEMHNIVKDYSKIGKRNSNAIEHGKLGKHMMHLIRLYMMALDILENEMIVTYREKEHELLMDIRNGKYLDDNMQPIPEFFEMVNDFENRMNYAKENTSLPDCPDYKQIQEFQMYVNKRVILGDI